MSESEGTTPSAPAGQATEPKPAGGDSVPRAELEKALSDVERLAREHAQTRSTAERQATDLASLRKFHEKALGQVERLKTEKGVLEAEKEELEKKLASALAAQREAESALSEARKLELDVRRLEGEKEALEKQIAELRAARVVPPPPPPLAETKEMAVLPAQGTPEWEKLSQKEPPKAEPAPASGKPAQGSMIKYLCEKCGRKLGAPPGFAGSFGTCRHCGHRGKVPLQSTR